MAAWSDYGPETLALLEAFYDRFEPVPSDPDYNYQAVSTLARHLMIEERFDDAIDAIAREVEALPGDAPYAGYRLPVAYLGLFRAAGREDDAIALIRRGRTAVVELVRNLRADGVAADPETLPAEPHHLPGAFHRFERGLEADWPADAVRLRNALDLAQALETALAELTPGFASPPPSPDPRPPGARGFDFLYGSWEVHNRVLQHRLSDSDDWNEWNARLDVVPILGGMGNVDRYRTLRDGAPYEGMTIRLYRPETDDWFLYWVDSRNPEVSPQVSGRMSPDGGTFFGEEMFEGRVVRMRFIWSNANGGEVCWEQAYQTADGAWEVNWMMTFTRVD